MFRLIFLVISLNNMMLHLFTQYLHRTKEYMSFRDNLKYRGTVCRVYINTMLFCRRGLHMYGFGCPRES